MKTEQPMKTNHELINTFFTAFNNLDAENMMLCYHPMSTFTDPVFGELTHQETVVMWGMLCENAVSFSLTFEVVRVDDDETMVNWVAHYLFTQTGRTVTNKVTSFFELDAGLIINQKDYFSLWKWSRTAFGVTGFLLGWSPIMKKTIRAKSLGKLKRYQSKYSAF